MRIEYIIAIVGTIFVLLVVGFLAGDLYGYHIGYYNAQSAYKKRHKEEIARIEKQCSIYWLELTAANETVRQLSQELTKVKNKTKLEKEIREKMKVRDEQCGSK